MDKGGLTPVSAHHAMRPFLTQKCSYEPVSCHTDGYNPSKGLLKNKDLYVNPNKATIGGN